MRLAVTLSMFFVAFGAAALGAVGIVGAIIDDGDLAGAIGGAMLCGAIAWTFVSAGVRHRRGEEPQTWQDGQ